MRFGLEDGMSQTLEDVGKEFNITRERVAPDRGKGFTQTPPSHAKSKVARLSGLIAIRADCLCLKRFGEVEILTVDRSDWYTAPLLSQWSTPLSAGLAAAIEGLK